jgi:hypothetical protein
MHLCQDTFSGVYIDLHGSSHNVRTLIFGNNKNNMSSYQSRNPYGFTIRGIYFQESRHDSADESQTISPKCEIYTPHTKTLKWRVFSGSSSGQIPGV